MITNPAILTPLILAEAAGASAGSAVISSADVPEGETVTGEIVTASGTLLPPDARPLPWNGQNGLCRIFREVSGAADEILPVLPHRITTARQALRLKSSLATHIGYLSEPLERIRWSAPMAAVRPHMVLSASGKFIVGVERVHLEGEAPEVYPDRKKDVERAKSLLLLNVLGYENRHFLERNFVIFDQIDTAILIRHLAMLFFQAYQDNQINWNGEEHIYAHHVQEGKKLLNTYQILFSWICELCPETAGIFKDYFAQAGFPSIRVFFSQFEEQLRAAQKKLADQQQAEFLRSLRKGNPAAPAWI